MKIFAITMVRNEEDIIAYNIRHLLNQDIDGILVADNLSTDKTTEILDALALLHLGKVWVVYDSEPGYYQSDKMTKLANEAHNLGADFIIPFDADELWYSMDPAQTVGSTIRAEGRDVVGVPMWNHYCTKHDKDDPNPFTRMQYRHEDQNPLDKIAFKWVPGCVIGQGNHNLYVSGAHQPGEAIGLGIRHFPYRSAEHFIRKVTIGASAYAATTLPFAMGAHWRQYGSDVQVHGEEHMKGHYRRWFTDECPGLKLVHDPAPYKG